MFRSRKHFSILLGKTNRYTDGSGRRLDGSEMPTDLYLEPMNDTERVNAYPARTGNWQPVVAGKPQRYRGNVVVSGAGIVGSTVASLFALRGWHVTILEQEKPAAGPNPESDPLGNFGPQKNFEVALMTKRGMDVLHSIGIRHKDIAAIGTKVAGVVDHASSVNSLLTYGLSELQNFSLNNVVVDLHALRQRLHAQIQRIPHQNGKIFFEHKAVAHLPEQKVVVVKPLAMDRTPTEAEANIHEKGIMVGGVRFEEYVEGIEYDFLIAADGRDSALRRMMQLDDSRSSNEGFAMAWFVVQGSPLDPQQLHRWLQRCAADDNPLKELGCIIAYPKGTGGHFAVQVYLPKSICDYYFGSPLQQQTRSNNKKTAPAPSSTSSSSSSNEVQDDNSAHDESVSQSENSNSQQQQQNPLDRVDEFIKRWCPQLKGQAMEGTISKPRPAPGLYMDHFYNYHNPFPNTILVGDACHSCNPFLLQGLSVALEDCASAINLLDSRGRSSYDSIRQYSNERGVATDRLRNITDRSLYYHEKKHVNPYLRFGNFYGQFMHVFLPRSWNEQYQGHSNYRYPRSVEAMMNGRGYASYEEIDAAQTRSNRFYCLMRLYA